MRRSRRKLSLVFFARSEVSAVSSSLPFFSVYPHSSIPPYFPGMLCYNLEEGVRTEDGIYLIRYVTRPPDRTFLIRCIAHNQIPPKHPVGLASVHNLSLEKPPLARVSQRTVRKISTLILLSRGLVESPYISPGRISALIAP